MNEKIKPFAAYVFFLAIAITLLVLYWVFQEETWAPVFLALAAALIAIVLVEIIWKLYGGDPITRAIAGVYRAIAALRTSTSLLRDLEGTGIERIHAQRRFTAFENWYSLINSAQEVDMMGITLRRDWTARDGFVKIVQSRAKERKCTFRILVLEPSPESPVTKQRMVEEGDIEERIAADAAFTLRVFDQIRNELDDEAREYIKTKVVRGSNLYCFVIRADDRILAANYLSYLRGSASPTMEIRSRDTSFFQVFAAEFERMWELGANWPQTIPTEETRAEG